MGREVGDIESIANDLRQTAEDLRVDTLLSFVRTSDVVNRYLDIELSKYGARRARSGILNVLIVHGGSMTPTDLSRKLFRSKHTITMVVDGLKKDGLVRREPIGEDRRIRKVAITKRGLEFVKTTVSHRQEIGYNAFSWLSDKRAQEFNAMLGQLRKHLLKWIDNPLT